MTSPAKAAAAQTNGRKRWPPGRILIPSSRPARQRTDRTNARPRSEDRTNARGPQNARNRARANSRARATGRARYQPTYAPWSAHGGNRAKRHHTRTAARNGTPPARQRSRTIPDRERGAGLGARIVPREGERRTGRIQRGAGRRTEKRRRRKRPRERSQTGSERSEGQGVEPDAKPERHASRHRRGEQKNDRPARPNAAVRYRSNRDAGPKKKPGKNAPRARPWHAPSRAQPGPTGPDTREKKPRKKHARETAWHENLPPKKSDMAHFLS